MSLGRLGRQERLLHTYMDPPPPTHPTPIPGRKRELVNRVVGRKAPFPSLIRRVNPIRMKEGSFAWRRKAAAGEGGSQVCSDQQEWHQRAPRRTGGGGW